MNEGWEKTKRETRSKIWPLSSLAVPYLVSGWLDNSSNESGYRSKVEMCGKRGVSTLERKGNSISMFVQEPSFSDLQFFGAY